MKFTLTDLENLAPCDAALDWARKEWKKTPSAAKLWDKCPSVDWMIWLLARLEGHSHFFTAPYATKFAIRVARPALPLFAAKFPNEKGIERAIQAAEACLKKGDYVLRYAARNAARQAENAMNGLYSGEPKASDYWAAYAARSVAMAAASLNDSWWWARHAASAAQTALGTTMDVTKFQARALRKVVGNPFRKSRKNKTKSPCKSKS